MNYAIVVHLTTKWESIHTFTRIGPSFAILLHSRAFKQVIIFSPLSGMNSIMIAYSLKTKIVFPNSCTFKDMCTSKVLNESFYFISVVLVFLPVRMFHGKTRAAWSSVTRLGGIGSAGFGGAVMALTATSMFLCCPALSCSVYKFDCTACQHV
jgi:hypothetical protein